MPVTRLVLYRDESGHVPVLDWLARLRRRAPAAYAKVVVRLERLAAEGHELRRPEADYLRDGIYELRARSRHVNYRVLYFFQGRSTAVLVRGLAKEGAIPATDITRTIDARRRFETSPRLHTHVEWEA
jgi:hypothetical protein